MGWDPDGTDVKAAQSTLRKYRKQVIDVATANRLQPEVLAAIVWNEQLGHHDYYSDPKNALVDAVIHLQMDAVRQRYTYNWGKWSDYQIAIILTRYNGDWTTGNKPGNYGKEWLRDRSQIRAILAGN
jgi:hypothetical protein